MLSTKIYRQYSHLRSSVSVCLVVDAIPNHNITPSTGYRGPHCEDESGIECLLEQLQYFIALTIIGEIGYPVGPLKPPARMWVQLALSPTRNIVAYLNGPTITISW